MLLRERTLALEAAQAALHRSEQELAAELEASQHLQQIATQLITAQGTGKLLEEVLDAARAIVHADFAGIQMYYPERGTSGELRLLSHRGFSPDAAKRWHWVGPFTRTTCGEALRTGRRVVVPDVRQCDFMSGSEDLDGYAEGGICAAQSTPLFSRSGSLLGMVSTHWREPRELSARELGALDILARLAADLIERSRAEDSQRAALEELRLITGIMPAGVARCSRDLRYLWVSPSLAGWLGRTPEEIAGQPIFDVIGQEYKRVLPHIEKVLSGEKEEYEAQVNYEGVGRRWIHAVCIPTRSKDGEVDGWIAIVTDVTERHEADEALRTSEARLKDAQRLAKLGSWERNPETGKICWSDETLRLFGISNMPDTFTGFLDLVHLKDRHIVLKAADDVQKAVSPVEASYRIIRPDGELHYVRAIVEAIRDRNGKVVRTVGSIQDITEQIEREKRLSDSEEHLKKAEQLSHIGHWQWDLRSGQISSSDEMYRIFGRRRDFTPTYGRFLEDVVPHDRERVSAAIEESIATKTGRSLEYQIVLSNGDLRTVSCVWEVHLDEEGSPSAMFGACQDITDAKRIQEESVARQKLESIGTLAGGIAHDFNNLLAGVLFQADVALGDCAAGLRPEEELKSIQDAAIRGSEIVRQLMIYAGKETAVEEVVDLSKITEEMLALLKISISKQVVLEVDLGKGLPLVSADAAQIRQVVMNLVMNASDSMGNGSGVIRVTTRRVDAGGGRAVQLEVSDTGCGMLPELQTRIFDPFFTTKTAGHGMGLAIVQGIVRGLGGTIHVMSEPDRGTTVQVTFSCADSATAGTTNPQRSVGELALQHPDAGILVVEDEGLLRQSVVKMLRKIGFEVFEAADGSSGIDLLQAKRGRIRVVLLDVTIPGATPLDVIAEAAKGISGVKVILTSAYSQEMFASMMSASQIHGFIRKPFQLANLLQMLQDVLSGEENRQSRAAGSER